MHLTSPPASTVLILKPESRHNGSTRHSVISRVRHPSCKCSFCLRNFSQPIPLEYLRLAGFDAAPENRREKASSTVEQTRLFESFRTRHRPMYPFTIYHASATFIRRYTLYANSEADRERWRKALVDAIGLRRVRQEANMVRLL